MSTLNIFTDGGARGNPGPAAIGFVVKDDTGKVLVKQGKYIGETTNNVAEYTAVIEALKWLKTNCSIVQLFNCSIVFFLDSKLVVCQLNGLYKIKKGHLQKLVIEIRKLEKNLGIKSSYHLLPREKNYDADFLVNKVLNERNP
jgi:ribonuclease HI